MGKDSELTLDLVEHNEENGSGENGNIENQFN